jgi:large conductance mechanosensitive channel
MIKEFREFIARGNVIDLAVGIIIGAAFTAIVNSLVADLITPIISLITGGINFDNTFLVLRAPEGVGAFTTLAAAQEAGALTLNIGKFITAVVNFLIIAFVVFLLVKAVNQLKRRQEVAEAVAEAAKPDPLVISQTELTAAINRLNENMTRRG